MFSRKKSTFLPLSFKNEDLSITLGNELPLDDDFFILHQDFYHTGEYYLSFKNKNFPGENANIDIRIFVIHFDKELSCLQYKVLRIKFPECNNCKNRKTEFDPVGGKVVHVIKRHSKTENECEELVCDIYYVDMAEFLDFHLQNYKVDEVIIKPKAKDFSLSWNMQEFNFVDHVLGFCDKDTRTLIFKAFYTDISDPLSDYESKCRIDILKLGNQNQIYHSNSIDLNFVYGFSRCWKIHVSPESIFCYVNMKYVDEETKLETRTLEIDEYDFKGNFISDYSVSKNEGLAADFKSIGNSTYLFLYPEEKGKKGNIRLLKFEKGREVMVFHIEGSAIDYKNCDVFCFMKRFDQWLLPQIIEERKEPPCYNFSLTNLETRQKLLQISDLRQRTLSPDYEYLVNWNMNEIARMFWDDDDQYIFKISRRATPENVTLKHLARMTALTSFSEEYLSNQNLPQTLFQYLGINKQR